jgi:LPXTG-motif cell wall-anchored protein
MAVRAPRSTRKVVGVTATVAVGLVSLLFNGATASAAEPQVGLGTATSFAVLAGSTVTNTGPTQVSGDLGVSPGTAITGFPPGTVSNGTIHAADGVADTAQSDVTIAYVDAAGRSTTEAISADLADRTLKGGVFTGPTLSLNGTLTLDAEGDPNTVFVFQAGSTLITGSSSRVELINGASACNVTWQVGSSATLGTTSTMVGTVLALTSITLNTDADVTGRVLARNGAVTLDSNTISVPDCTVVPPTTTSTSTSSTSTTGSSTSTSTSTSTPTSSSTTSTPTSTSTTSTTLPPLVTTTSTSTSTTSTPASTSTSTTLPPLVTTTSTTTTPPTSTSTSTTSIPPSSTSSTTLPQTTSSTTAPEATTSTTILDSGPTTVPGPSSTSTIPIRTTASTTTIDLVVDEATTTVPVSSSTPTTATRTSTDTGTDTSTDTSTFTSGGPSLPRTGSSTGGLTLAGLALIGVGGALILAARRRVTLRS